MRWQSSPPPVHGVALALGLTDGVAVAAGLALAVGLVVGAALVFGAALVVGEALVVGATLGFTLAIGVEVGWVAGAIDAVAAGDAVGVVLAAGWTDGSFNDVVRGSEPPAPGLVDAFQPAQPATRTPRLSTAANDDTRVTFTEALFVAAGFRRRSNHRVRRNEPATDVPRRQHDRRDIGIEAALSQAASRKTLFSTELLPIGGEPSLCYIIVWARPTVRTRGVTLLPDRQYNVLMGQRGPERAPRGRPRNIERRSAIARTALRLYGCLGYEGATMREIAQACGMSESLLYRYYASKSELFEAVLDHVLEVHSRLRATLVEVSAHARTLRDFLTGAATIVAAHIDEMNEWYAVRFTTLPITANRREQLRASYERLLEILADGLRRLGQWRDPAVAARTLWATLLGFILYQNRTGFEPRTSSLRKVFVDELLEILAHAERAMRKEITA